MKSSCLILAALAFGSPARAEEPSAATVLERVETARKIQDLRASASVTTEAEGQSKVKTFTLWSDLADGGSTVRTLARFLSPPTIRNEGVLIIERNGGNDVLLYLPRYKKIRRVESSSQSSSFMGTVFSYADMGVQRASEWEHRRLRKEPCPGASTVTCHVISSTPKNAAVQRRTGYGKAVQWVRQDNWVAMRGEFYDTNGQLKKVATASDVKQVSRTPERWMALTLKLEDVQAHKTTILRLRQVQVDQNIPDSVFTPQSLSREQ